MTKRPGRDEENRKARTLRCVRAFVLCKTAQEYFFTTAAISSQRASMSRHQLELGAAAVQVLLRAGESGSRCRRPDSPSGSGCRTPASSASRPRAGTRFSASVSVPAARLEKALGVNLEQRKVEIHLGQVALVLGGGGSRRSGWNRRNRWRTGRASPCPGR